MSEELVPPAGGFAMEIGEKPSTRKSTKRRTKTSVGNIELGRNSVFTSELACETALLAMGKQPTIKGEPLSPTTESIISESEDGGISVAQASVIFYLCTTGIGACLMGSFAKNAGYLGYMIAFLFVAPTAILADSAIFSTARRTGATTFSELCTKLPSSLNLLTTICGYIFNMTCGGLFTSLFYSAVNQQIFARLGDGDFPNGEALPGKGRTNLYLGIMLSLYVVSLPTSFSGTLAKVMNNMNGVCMVVLVGGLVIKGLLVYFSTEPPPETAHTEDDNLIAITGFSGVLKCVVLLASMMIYTGCLPQLCSQVSEDQREKAVMQVPTLTCAAITVAYGAVGLASYCALGNGIKGDVAKQYVFEYPGIFVTIIQFDIIMIVYLCIPLVMLPPKAQMWNIISKPLGFAGPLDQAPAAARFGLNAICIVNSVSLPMLMSEQMFMKFLTLTFSTVGTYVNILLPALVITYEDVIPKMQAGEPWIRSALGAGWIFFFSFMCLCDAFITICEMIL